MEKQYMTVEFDRLVAVWARETVGVFASDKKEAIELAKEKLLDEGPLDYEYINDSEHNLLPGKHFAADCTETIFVEDEEVFANKVDAFEFRDIQKAECKETLSKMGYAVETLWGANDVMSRFNCTHEKALQIMNQVLQSPAVMETINDCIGIVCNDLGLEEYQS